MTVCFSDAETFGNVEEEYMATMRLAADDFIVLAVDGVCQVSEPVGRYFHCSQRKTVREPNDLVFLGITYKTSWKHCHLRTLLSP